MHYLRHLHSRHSSPWLCIGDFNEILVSKEKQWRIPKPLKLMQEFHSALLHCGLINLRFHGNVFTSNNGHHGDSLSKNDLIMLVLKP